MKHWLVLAAVGLAVATWMFRWSEPVAVGKNTAFVVDRFTGQWWYMTQRTMIPFEKFERVESWSPPPEDERVK